MAPKENFKQARTPRTHIRTHVSGHVPPLVQPRRIAHNGAFPHGLILVVVHILTYSSMLELLGGFTSWGWWHSAYIGGIITAP